MSQAQEQNHSTSEHKGNVMAKREKLTTYIGRDVRGIAVLLDAAINLGPDNKRTRVEAYFWNLITEKTEAKFFEAATGDIDEKMAAGGLLGMSRSWLNGRALQAAPLEGEIAHKGSHVEEDRSGTAEEPDKWSPEKDEVGEVFWKLSMEAMPLVSFVYKATRIPGLGRTQHDNVLKGIVGSLGFIETGKLTELQG